MAGVTPFNFEYGAGLFPVKFGPFSGSRLCDVYLFDGADPDYHSFTPAYSGFLQVIVIAASETGLHADVIAGRQGVFVPSTDPLVDMQQNQYELAAVVSLAGIVDATFSGRIAYSKDGVVWYDLDIGAAGVREYYDFSIGTDPVIQYQRVGTDFANDDFMCKWSTRDMFGGNGAIMSQNVLAMASNREFTIYTFAGQDDLFIITAGVETIIPDICTTTDSDYEVVVTGSNVVVTRDGVEVFNGALSRGTASEPSAVFKVGARSDNTVASRGFVYDRVLYDVEFNGEVISAIDDGFGTNPVIANAGTLNNGVAIGFAGAGWENRQVINNDDDAIEEVQVANHTKGTCVTKWVEPAGLVPEFLEQYSDASTDLFGATSHTFNITAPSETDGVVFVVLVQLKNPGVQNTTITIDGGTATGNSSKADSNPGGKENQMAIFEDKVFGSGAHSVEVTNIDGMDGVTIIAVYYKNYTGLTGNFSQEVATGAQASSVTVGQSLSTSVGNRGLSVMFAGSLTDIVTIDNPTDYETTVVEFPTTDTGDNRYNGKLITAVDLSFSGVSSLPDWTVNYTGSPVGEIITITGELGIVNAPNAIISTLIDSEATTLGDDIIHTGA